MHCIDIETRGAFRSWRV